LTSAGDALFAALINRGQRLAQVRLHDKTLYIPKPYTSQHPVHHKNTVHPNHFSLGQRVWSSKQLMSINADHDANLKKATAPIAKNPVSPTRKRITCAILQDLTRKKFTALPSAASSPPSLVLATADHRDALRALYVVPIPHCIFVTLC
jgi:hypothetical protein